MPVSHNAAWRCCSARHSRTPRSPWGRRGKHSTASLGRRPNTSPSRLHPARGVRDQPLRRVRAASRCEDAINLLRTTIGSPTAILSNPVQRFVRDVRVLTSHGAIRIDQSAEQNGRRLLDPTDSTRDKEPIRA
ncbi:hypothetical protein [Streptomyces sp. NBC_00459]|uniref:hypothetical protein n=1 Tax=Streptomyces sp. NBC_00459 TaxID=2975749 RepID=UPI002E178568